MALAAPQPYKRLPRPARKYWSRAEFDALVEDGKLRPEQRLELIEGEIVTRMSHKPLHASCLTLVQSAILRAFRDGFVVRIQLPLAVGDWSEPEPDVLVVKGNPRDFGAVHPTTGVLVVEIADTSLQVDRLTKAALYARAGIPEYWLVNLRSRCVEVHRDPVPSPTAVMGHVYSSIRVVYAGDTMTPLCAPDAEIPIDSLLP